MERNKMIGLLVGLLFVFSTLAYLARGVSRTLPSGEFQGTALATVLRLYDQWLVPAGVDVNGLNVVGATEGYMIISGDENVLNTLLERNAPVVYRYALVDARLNLNGSEYDLNLPAYVFYTRKEGDLIPISYYLYTYAGRVERAFAFDLMTDLTH